MERPLGFLSGQEAAPTTSLIYSSVSWLIIRNLLYQLFVTHVASVHIELANDPELFV